MDIFQVDDFVSHAQNLDRTGRIVEITRIKGQDLHYVKWDNDDTTRGYLSADLKLLKKKAMTYRKLAQIISDMSGEQLDSEVTLYDISTDEFCKVLTYREAGRHDEIEEGTPFLEI